MNKIKNLWAALIVNAALFLALLYISWSGPEILSHYLFHDDSFYYFKIAENFNNGLGVTFSGLTETSGFHPLWLWILICTSHLLEAYINKNIAIYASLFNSFIIMNAILIVGNNIFSRTINSKLLLKISGAVILLMIWRYVYDGMESGIVIIIILCAFNYLLAKKYIAASVFLGALAFARVDIYVLLNLTGFMYLFYLLFKNKNNLLEKIKQNFRLTIQIVICLCVVAIFGILRNNIMPDQISSKVKIFWFVMSYQNNGIIYTIFDSLKNLLSSYAQISWPFEMFNPIWYANSNEMMPKYIKLIGGVGILLLFLYYLYVVIKLNKSERSEKYILTLLLGVASIFFMAVHSIVGSMSANWQWYLSFPAITFVISGMIALDRKVDKLKFVNLSNTLQLLILTIFLARFLNSMMEVTTNQFRYLYSDIVNKINEEDYNGAVIGTWAAGHIGYFYAGNAVNLEGLVENSEVLNASFNDDISNIVRKYNIKYIITKSTFDEVNTTVEAANRGEKMNRSNQRNRVFKDLNFDLDFEKNINKNINYSIIKVKQGEF